MCSHGTITPPSSATDLIFTVGTPGVPSADVVFAGTLAKIESNLPGFVYAPQDDWSSEEAAAAATLTFTVNDQGNVGATTLPLTATSTLYVIVTEVNDAAIVVSDYVGNLKITEGVEKELGTGES